MWLYRMLEAAVRDAAMDATSDVRLALSVDSMDVIMIHMSHPGVIECVAHLTLLDSAVERCCGPCQPQYMAI